MYIKTWSIRLFRARRFQLLSLAALFYTKSRVTKFVQQYQLRPSRKYLNYNALPNQQGNLKYHVCNYHTSAALIRRLLITVPVCFNRPP